MEYRHIRLERPNADGAVEFCLVEVSGRDVSVTRGRGDEPGVRTTRQAVNDQWVGEMFDKAVRRLRGEGFADPRASKPTEPVDAVGTLPDSDPAIGVVPGANGNSGLLFAAGQAVHARGWTSVEVITTAEIAAQTPAGDPLIVVASVADVSVDHARALAALHGAGRPVLLVTDDALSDAVAAWIAPDSVVVAPTTSLATMPTRKATDRVMATKKEPESTPAPTTDRRTELQNVLLTRLAADPDERVRASVAENPHTPPEILARLASDEYPSGLTYNPNTPPEVLARFLTDPRRWRSPYEIDRMEVAQNPNTPPEALARLAGDEDSEVVNSVARNPRTPPEVLARLASDPDEYGDPHYEVLRNPSTPPEILERFASPLDEDAPETVTEWPRTQSEVLAHLATDPDYNVRAAVAGNPHTPTDTLARLANDPEWTVRSSVAGNPHAPSEALAHLASDSDKYTRSGVASNPHALSETLAHLAADSYDYTRLCVASNPHTPPETLTRLAADPYKGVREGVAGNPRTQPEVIERLARDADGSMHAGVASNPATPMTVLEAMVSAAGADQPLE